MKYHDSYDAYIDGMGGILIVMNRISQDTDTFGDAIKEKSLYLQPGDDSCTLEYQLDHASDAQIRQWYLSQYYTDDGEGWDDGSPFSEFYPAKSLVKIA